MTRIYRNERTVMFYRNEIDRCNRTIRLQRIIRARSPEDKVACELSASREWIALLHRGQFTSQLDAELAKPECPG